MVSRCVVILLLNVCMIWCHLFNSTNLFRLLSSYTTRLISSVFVLCSAAGRVVMSKTEMTFPVSTGCLIGLVMDSFLLLMSAFRHTMVNESVTKLEEPLNNTHQFLFSRLPQFPQSFVQINHFNQTQQTNKRARTGQNKTLIQLVLAEIHNSLWFVAVLYETCCI